MVEFLEMGYLKIDEYPKYLLNPIGPSIISFHRDANGLRIQRIRDWEDGVEGYRLYNNGVSEFFSIARLKAIVAKHKLKEMRKEMNTTTTKTSLSGIIQRGDYIVGSINKSTGVFSASTSPARHMTLAGAREEAARLAGVDKSKKYVVLNVQAIASVEAVNWE